LIRSNLLIVVKGFSSNKLSSTKFRLPGVISPELPNSLLAYDGHAQSDSCRRK